MTSTWKAMLLRSALGGATLLGGMLLSSGVVQAHERDSRCFERIRREQWKLERDIERHGIFSRQAEHRRWRMRELRDRCGFERRQRHHSDWQWHGDDRFRGGHHRREREDDDRWEHRGHRHRRW